MTPRIHNVLKTLAVVHALLGTNGAAPAQTLGDRLVIAINNVPYSQRQVETYIAIKECLRKTANDEVRLVTAGNWSDAIAVFSEDMTVLQEAQRLGSFQNADQLLDKYQKVVKDKIAKNADLKTQLTRLGIDDQGVARALETVLRVAAFRRSKDRQAQISGEREPTVKGDAAAPRWLTDLEDRSVSRQYEGVRTYQIIEPTLGRERNGG